MADQQSQAHYTRTTVGALALGLLSLPAAFLPFGVVVALVALELGFFGRREATERGQPLKMANAALLLGAIALGIWIVVMTGFAAFAWLYEG